MWAWGELQIPPAFLPVPVSCQWGMWLGREELGRKQILKGGIARSCCWPWLSLALFTDVPCSPQWEHGSEGCGALPLPVMVVAVGGGFLFPASTPC